MALQLLAAYREYSGRGVDFDEDMKPLGELVDRFPEILIPIPVFLAFLFFAYILLSRRKAVTQNEDQRWYFTSDNDNGWYKTFIIFGWVAGVLCVLPAVVTGFEIVWRVVVGGAITIVSWILSWVISIIVLVLMIGVVPWIGFASLADKHKIFGGILGSLLLCVTLYMVVLYWDSIMDWSFMFPPLEFNL